MTRPDWDTYFLNLARVVATRSTCNRASVGVVVVDAEHMVLATGYNGAPSGSEHCLEDESKHPDHHCQLSLHAEQNVVGHAARRGTRLDGATWYVVPFDLCRSCRLLVTTTNPKRIVFGE